MDREIFRRAPERGFAFKIGDIFSDSKVLKEAADAAGTVLAKDELLSSEENVYLKTKVEEYTKECLENINL